MWDDIVSGSGERAKDNFEVICRLRISIPTKVTKVTTVRVSHHDGLIRLDYDQWYVYECERSLEMCVRFLFFDVQYKSYNQVVPPTRA